MKKKKSGVNCYMEYNYNFIIMFPSWNTLLSFILTLLEQIKDMKNYVKKTVHNTK